MTLNHWDVDPGVARAVISTTHTHAESFTSKEDALQVAMEDAATATMFLDVGVIPG